jgi:hypothetical protein
MAKNYEMDTSHKMEHNNEPIVVLIETTLKIEFANDRDRVSLLIFVGSV